MAVMTVVVPQNPPAAPLDSFAFRIPPKAREDEAVMPISGGFLRSDHGCGGLAEVWHERQQITERR